MPAANRMVVAGRERSGTIDDDVMAERGRVAGVGQVTDSDRIAGGKQVRACPGEGDGIAVDDRAIGRLDISRDAASNECVASTGNGRGRTQNNRTKPAISNACSVFDLAVIASCD